MLNQFKKILFICAHPDDEVIGCGGTISLLSKNKSEINLLVLTNGESSRNLKSKNLKKKIKERKIALYKSSNTCISISWYKRIKWYIIKFHTNLILHT